jgi:hypothetical protein
VHLWQRIGAGLPDYNDFPRILGETGGKDFTVTHPSADIEVLAADVIRSSRLAVSRVRPSSWQRLLARRRSRRWSPTPTMPGSILRPTTSSTGASLTVLMAGLSHRRSSSPRAHMGSP